MRVEQITEPLAEHGEGPVWWPAWGGLCWLDMLRGDVLRLNSAGAADRWHVGSVAAALRPRGATGAVVATERAFAVTSQFGAALETVAVATTDPAVRFNDGCCDPEGNFYCGTMRYDATPAGGALYRLRPDLTLDEVLHDVTVSNGLSWSPDGTMAYYVDTASGRIDVFDHEPGSGLRNRRPFAVVDPGQGSPDGLTVDADGGVWVALWAGGAVHRYADDGGLSAVVEVPVRQVTSCAFGGTDLSELYITTSRLGQDDGASSAGALFLVRPGVAGLPTATFGG